MPPDSWIGEITRSPFLESARVLSVMINEGKGHAVLEVEKVTQDSILDRLRNREELLSVDLLAVDGSRSVLQIETEQTSILEPFLSAGVPLDTPIRFENGDATWRFTTSQERLMTLSSHLAESGLTYQVERIREVDSIETAAEPDLTERQDEILSVAAQQGYFELPRAVTLDAIAAKTGVSKSTVNEILRRGVRNLVHWHY